MKNHKNHINNAGRDAYIIFITYLHDHKKFQDHVWYSEASD